MKSDQFLNEGQANPCAFERPGMSFFDAMKALEDTLAVLLGYPYSRIADLQLGRAVLRLHRDHYGTVQCKLERIGQKIQRPPFPTCRGRRTPFQQLAGILRRIATQRFPSRNETRSQFPQ